jgi:quercetin dioxygenase-like cupin family protein
MGGVVREIEVSFQGVGRVRGVVQTVSANEITFGHSRFAPRTSVHKKHIHRNAEEIMYILSGRGVAGVNDQETVVTSGDTIWVPKGAVHWFSNPFDEPCEFVFLYTKSSLTKAAYEMVDGEHRDG